MHDRSHLEAVAIPADLTDLSIAFYHFFLFIKF